MLAKNIKEYIISININNNLSEYELTTECIKYINNQYLNKLEEP